MERRQLPLASPHPREKARPTDPSASRRRPNGDTHVRLSHLLRLSLPTHVPDSPHHTGALAGANTPYQI